MGLKVDTENPDLFVEYKVKILPPGLHTFEVANALKVEACSGDSVNQKIEIELRSMDEDENKGALVYDRILLMTNPQTEGQHKAKAIHEAKLAQFTIACGILSQEDIASGIDIELDNFQGATCQATTGIGSYKNKDGQDKQKTTIENYKFQV